MSQHIGREQWIGVGLEDSAGSGGSIDKYIPLVSGSFMTMTDILPDEAARGIRHKVGWAVLARTRGEGSVEMQLDVENSPYFLYPVMGSISSITKAGETAVYTHTISRENTATPKTLVAKRGEGVDVREYANIVVSSANLTVSDWFVGLSCDLLSKAGTSETGSPTYTTETLLSLKDCSIQLGTDLTAAALAAATKVTELELNIVNNAEAHYMSGSSDVDTITYGTQEITGSFVKLFESTTERAAYEALTKRAMIITITGESIGNSSTETIQINIAKMHLSGHPIEMGLDDIMAETSEFTCEYDPTTAKDVQIVITNQTSSYA